MQGSPSITDMAVLATRGIAGVSLDHADESLNVLDARLKILVLAGSCVVQRFIAGQWIEMRRLFRGGVVVTEASTSVRVENAATPQGIMLLISRDGAESSFSRLTDSLSVTSHVYFPRDPVIESLIKVLEAASRGTAPCVEEHVLCAVAFRISVLSQREAVHRPAKQLALPSWRLQRVIGLIQERLDREVALADMASAAGLSPMHFAAQFRVATGMRPHHFLIAERMDRAKRLLKNTSDSIMEIALAVGFQTQAHFTTVFKRYENTTPLQWRNAHRQLNDSTSRASHPMRGVSFNG